YTLGYASGVFIHGEKSGYLIQVSNLSKPSSEWTVCAIPLVSLIDIQTVKSSSVRRHPPFILTLLNSSYAVDTPSTRPRRIIPSGKEMKEREFHNFVDTSILYSIAVPPRRVNLNSAIFRLIAKNRIQWALQDFFKNPGPLQFHGPLGYCLLHSLNDPYLNPTKKLKEISELCLQVKFRR
ncbi:hypothetical protein IE077_001865, partial [Cardiosporidium cionae]